VYIFNLTKQGMRIFRITTIEKRSSVCRDVHGRVGIGNGMDNGDSTNEGFIWKIITILYDLPKLGSIQFSMPIFFRFFVLVYV
jgi:hypothetical protein